MEFCLSKPHLETVLPLVEMLTSFGRTSVLLGYARVSTDGQDHALQLDALRAAGCEKVFVETASGTRTDRPELAKALDQARQGDVLVVWRLDPARTQAAASDRHRRRSEPARHRTEVADSEHRHHDAQRTFHVQHPRA